MRERAPRTCGKRASQRTARKCRDPEANVWLLRLRKGKDTLGLGQSEQGREDQEVS